MYIHWHRKNTEVPIIGNQLCWYGNLVYLLKDLEDPTQKLIQVYNKREKKYGKVNVGDKVAKKALLDWCDYCGIRKDRLNNMWAHRSKSAVFSMNHFWSFVLNRICYFNVFEPVSTYVWARKTMINTALHELLLPEQMVMNLSGHKSATQMRKDYCIGWFGSSNQN